MTDETTLADRYGAGVERAGVRADPPELLAAAVRLVAVFDKLKSATRAERIITGLSDQGIRKEGDLALADLRDAVARAVAVRSAAPDLLAALAPLARKEIPRNPHGNAGMYVLTHDEIRRAQAAIATLTTGGTHD